MTFEEELAKFAAEKGLFECDARKLDLIARGYLEAVAFTDGATGSEDALADLDLMRSGQGAWGDGELARIFTDCDAFARQAQPIIARHIGFADLEIDTQTGREGYTPEQVGRDFWLTRNGHGVGFWDRSFVPGGAALGQELSTLADSFLPRDAYRGDDGRAYLA